MLAKYTWLSTATQAQMLDDICKLIAGASIASLSASCDKVNSQIIANTLQNNWTVFDAAAGASAQVLRSRNSDGVSYKYAHLSYTGNTLNLTSHEAWNASTHIGTNQACTYTNALTIQLVTAAFTAAAGGTLYIHATSHILCFGSSAYATAFPVLNEFVRSSPILNNTYPAHSLGMTGLCRVKHGAAVGDLKYGSTPAYTSGGTHNAYTVLDTLIRKPDGSFVYTAKALYQVAVVGASNAVITLGEILGIRLMGKTPPCNFMDEIDVDGVRHVIFMTPALTNNTIAYIVPKG